MKLRPLIYGLLGLTALLLVLRFSLLWQAEQTARQLDAQQVSAERMAEEASRLLVVTQDNLLYANERSAQQWRALYRALNTDLDNLAASDRLNPVLLQGMRATLEDLQQIFDRLQVVRGQLQGADQEAALDILRSRLVQALRQVTDQSFSYAVEVSDERIKNRERDRNLVLAVNGGLLVVVVLLAHLLLRRVLRPLQRLADTARQVQEGGTLDRRVNYTAPDEMGLAAQTFDGMLQRLSTTQNALEKALAEQRREREVLASIIEGTNVGTWEWNVQTGETRFNERWANIIGRRLIDLQPTDIDTWTAHAHPDDLVQSGALLQAHFSGQTPHYECEARMRHRDGRWIWVLDRGRVFTRTADGQPEWMYGTHQDITARKTLEISLRSNEAFLARVGEVAGVGGAEYDPQHNTVRWSDEWRRIVEVDADYVPTPQKALDFIDPAFRARAKDVMRSLLKHGQPFDEVAVWITGRGRRIWVRTTGEPVFSQTHPPVLVSVVASIQDVTAEREAREALALAKAQAEVANQAKSQFLANMSHELRTPLNALLGIQRLLGDSLMDARQREWLAKANTAGQALLGIINDVLDLARIEAGEMPLVETPIRPLEVARSITDVYGLPAQGKGLSLVFEADPDLPGWVLGDADRLRQALANLVGNAIKFTAEGSVVLRLAQFETDGQAWLRWSVIDTGPGIEADALQRLFQPFVQADASITRRFGGTGLGLSIVKQLAGLMKGRAWAESEPAVGSRFHFEHPLRLPMAEETRQAELGSRPVSVALRLADAPMREALRSRLIAIGWACTSNADSAEADADLFVVDAALGPEGVLEATHALRNRSPEQPAGHCLLVGTPEAFDALDLEGVQLPNAVRIDQPTSALGLLQAAVNLLAHAPGIHVRLFRGEGALSPGVCWLSGVRLLVVDDNEINRKVAAELLRDQGATCHACENGQEALDWLAAHPNSVDAVLMDVQMPVLDGLSACRRLKADPATARLPVLGLTAGVLASEREAGLAAGMDGFLSKPIVPAELVRHLRDAVARASGRPVPVTLDHKIRPASSESDWPAFPGIDLGQARLNTSHNPQLYQRLLRVLLNQYRSWGQEWSERAARPDSLLVPAFQASLHRLRGSAATLGATALAQQAQEAEEAAARPGVSIATLVTLVAGRLQAVLQPLEQWQTMRVQEQALLQAGSLSRADLRWLDHLAMLLSEHYLDAVEWVAQGDPELTRMFGGEKAAALRAAIDRLDFDTAHGMVQDVLERAEPGPRAQNLSPA